MKQAQPSTTAPEAALRPVSGQKTATGVFDMLSEGNLRETQTFTPRLRWGVRYSQADPIGLDGGANLYTYAGQNPLLQIDPYGLDFYNQTRFDVCVQIDGGWERVPAGGSRIGDVDGVVAPRGHEFEEHGNSNRVYKWVDCFHATLEENPGWGIRLVLHLKSDEEIDAIDNPGKRWCCKCDPLLCQVSPIRGGGSMNPWGEVDSKCP